MEAAAHLPAHFGPGPDESLVKKKIVTTACYGKIGYPGGASAFSSTFASSRGLHMYWQKKVLADSNFKFFRQALNLQCRQHDGHPPHQQDRFEPHFCKTHVKGDHMNIFMNSVFNQPNRVYSVASWAYIAYIDGKSATALREGHGSNIYSCVCRIATLASLKNTMLIK